MRRLRITRKQTRIAIIAAIAVAASPFVLFVALIIGAGVYGVLFPGPDTLVINDTSQEVTLTECGDTISQIPPGDVNTLAPGKQALIGSSRGQESNTCDVHTTGKAEADACLPLTPGGTVYISRRLKPLPANRDCGKYTYANAP